jgi:alkyl hydroperoxide reductase subunit AhpC
MDLLPPFRPGDPVPLFRARASNGVESYDFASVAGRYVVLAFLGSASWEPARRAMAAVREQRRLFDDCQASFFGISVDPVDRHSGWAEDIRETQGTAPNFPMIGDPKLEVSKLYGMLPAEAGDQSEGRTGADNQTVRNVFVIGPDKKIKLVLVYPMTTGRNFDEVLRVIDSLQLTAAHRVSTPVNWRQGEKVIIAGSVSNEEARELWPDGWEEPKPYIRIVDQPA